VVDPQCGTYLCVTLAQSHVLRASLYSLPWIEALCADVSLGSEAIRVHQPLSVTPPSRQYVQSWRGSFHQKSRWKPAGTLLSSLLAGWRIAIHKPPPPPDMARAPLQPLLVVAQRDPQLVAAGSAPPVELKFSAAAGRPDTEQLADAVQVSEGGTKTYHHGI